VPIAGQNERRASHRFGGVLWQRNFRLLWTGESISAIGNAMAVVGVPLLAVAVLHASTFAVAALTAAAYLPWLVIGLPVGAWVDRLPCRPPIYSAAANLAYSGSTAIVVVFLVRVVGLSAAATGLLMATGGIGGVFGALTARRLAQWLGTARAMLLAAFGAGLSGLLIPLTTTGPRAACYAIGSVMVAAGMVIGNIIVGSFRQAYCPPSMLGRVTASMRFLGLGAIPLGALLAGGLGTALSVRTALWIILALYALSGTILLTRAIRMNRNLPAGTAPAARPAP
jgi:hypothetical protein